MRKETLKGLMKSSHLNITLHYNDNKYKTVLKQHSNKMDIYKQLLSWMSVCACVCVCVFGVCAELSPHYMEASVNA